MTCAEQTTESTAEIALALPKAEVLPPSLPGIGYGIWTLIKMQLLPGLVFLPFAIASVATGRKHLLTHPLVALLGLLFGAGWIIRGYCRQNSLKLTELAGPLTLFPSLLLAMAAAVVGLLMIEVPTGLWLMVRFPFLEPKLDFGVAQSPWAAFLLVVVAAPLTEEFIFRGILLRSLIPRYGRNGAILASAIFFSAAHLYPVRMLGMLLAGMLFGWVAGRVGSVWPGVWAHVFNNGIAFAFMIFAKESTPREALQQLGGWAVAVLLAGMVALSLGVYAARRVTTVQPA